jgi:hypothetical protein
VLAFADGRSESVGESRSRVPIARAGLRPGQEPGDAVYAEKLREDAIRVEDWKVVRWTWADLRNFAVTAARIRERFRT